MKFLNFAIKYVLFICFLLITLFFIRPQKIYNEPRIIGKVIDKNNIPLNGAIVYRITKVSSKNKEFGYFETKEIYTGKCKTDANGNFIIDKDFYIKWFHTPFDLKNSYCCTKIEIKKDGFITYKSDDKDFEIKDNNDVACKGIEFNSIIILEKIQ